MDSASALFGNYAHKDLVEFEDAGVATLRFKNGAIAALNYCVNSYSKNMEGSITVFGDKGTVKIGGQYLNELEYQDIEGPQIKDLPAGNKANEYGEYQGSMSNHREVYKMFLRRWPAKSIATNCRGLKTVEIIEKIYQSRPENGF